MSYITTSPWKSPSRHNASLATPRVCRYIPTMISKLFPLLLLLPTVACIGCSSGESQTIKSCLAPVFSALVAIRSDPRTQRVGYHPLHYDEYRHLCLLHLQQPNRCLRITDCDHDRLSAIIQAALSVVCIERGGFEIANRVACVLDVLDRSGHCQTQPMSDRPDSVQQHDCRELRRIYWCIRPEISEWCGIRAGTEIETLLEYVGCEVEVQHKGTKGLIQPFMRDSGSISQRPPHVLRIASLPSYGTRADHVVKKVHGRDHTVHNVHKTQRAEVRKPEVLQRLQMPADQTEMDVKLTSNLNVKDVKVIQNAPHLRTVSTNIPVQSVVKHSRETFQNSKHSREVNSPTSAEWHRPESPSFSKRRRPQAAPAQNVQSSVFGGITETCRLDNLTQLWNCLEPLAEWWQSKEPRSGPGFPLFSLQLHDVLHACDLYASAFLHCTPDMFSACADDEAINELDSIFGYACAAGSGFFGSMRCVAAVLRQKKVQKCAQRAIHFDRCDRVRTLWTCSEQRLRVQCGGAATAHFANSLRYYGCIL